MTTNQPTPNGLSSLPSITGSFSHPARGNPTGAMVEAAYRHHGIDARFINNDVAPENLANAVAGARAMGWIGFNCSLPHKVAVIQHLDALDHSASLIGAVNCTVRRENRLVGHNTDGQGFLHSLRTLTDPAGHRVLILGAGGAARAIAVELALAGAAHITLANRSIDKAQEIASLVEDHTDTSTEAVAWTDTVAPADDITIVVNATSLGLPGRPTPPIDFAPDSTGLIVCDVIPNPPHTELLQRAQASGAAILDGRGMLLNQAAVNIELWTGVRPDRSIMRAALDQAIAAWQHP